MSASIKRMENWAILNNEAFDIEALKEMSAVPNAAMLYDKYYFACGHDAKRKKYADWFCTDLRDIPKVHKWNNLLGHPFKDATLIKVKSKLAIGMFTYTQAKFILRETARVLKLDGEFELTYRDFNLVLKRQATLPWRLFNRYLHGSGLYNGSMRKSCWTKKSLQELCKEYHLECFDTASTGMNVTLFFRRVAGNIKKFAPEPKVLRDEKGNIINDGGDFPGA